MSLLFREMLEASLAMRNGTGADDGSGGTGGELGYDWERASDQILHAKGHRARSRLRHPWSHWYEPGDWDWAMVPYQQHHQQLWMRGEGFQAGAPPPITLEELTAWLWTPETTAAFSLLLVVLALFLCCWISHKVGEFLCTTTAGITALALLVVVFFVFLSQWTAV